LAGNAYGFTVDDLITVNLRKVRFTALRAIAQVLHTFVAAFDFHVVKVT
jgi:hypothetical protein